MQQANCLAQLAEGRVAGGDAPACGNGIVAPDGSIAEPVRTPDFTIAFGGSYEIPLGGRLSLTPAINANWRDDQEVGTNEVSIYDAPITSTNGTPANPADDITFPGNQIGNGEFLTRLLFGKPLDRERIAAVRFRRPLLADRRMPELPR